MAHIKFLKNNQTIIGSVEQTASNVVRVLNETDTFYDGGFLVYKDADQKYMIGDYSAYKTEYKAGGYYSNDGSVYPKPEPKPEPTLREIVDELSTELTDTQLAVSDNYEAGIEISDELTNTQVAVTELYEIILGGE